MRVPWVTSPTRVGSYGRKGIVTWGRLFVYVKLVSNDALVCVGYGLHMRHPTNEKTSLKRLMRYARSIDSSFRPFVVETLRSVMPICGQEQTAQGSFLGIV